MDVARASNTATVLRDGRVLLAGGFPGEGQAPQSSAEIFDPVTNSFAVVGSMIRARADATATLLSDGRVLIAGGTDGESSLDSTEYFDPETDTFSAGPELTSPRSAHAAVLDHGRVILIGGTIDGHDATATTDVLHGGHWAAALCSSGSGSNMQRRSSRTDWSSWWGRHHDRGSTTTRLDRAARPEDDQVIAGPRPVRRGVQARGRSHHTPRWARGHRRGNQSRRVRPDSEHRHRPARSARSAVQLRHRDRRRQPHGADRGWLRHEHHPYRTSSPRPGSLSPSRQLLPLIGMRRR